MSSDLPAIKVRVFANDLEFWILVVDIPTQILHTILLPIDHSSRCKLKVYIIILTKEKPSTTNWYFCKLVRRWKSKQWAKFELEQNSKFELECVLPIFIYSNSNLKSLIKMRTSNAGTSGLIPKRNRLKLLTLHSPFCLIIIKTTQTKWLSWLLWHLLLLMKPLDALQNDSFQHKKYKI